MPNDTTERGADYLYEALVETGVELLVGLPGTQTLPLDRTVATRSEIDYLMARHETAVPHIAWGYYEANGGVAATLTIPGPGDTNALHGLKNALEDSVPIIHISADTNPEDRGKKPIHEIDPATYDAALKANINVEKRAELSEKIERGIETALTPPYGPVRLGIPSNVLDAELSTATASVSPAQVTFDTDSLYDRAVDLLSQASRPLVYLGGGVRRADGGPQAVNDLLDELNAPVATSFKGKGVFAEDDPRYLGTTSKHLPAGVKRVLDRADVVLALGTDFDGVTTGNWTLTMGEHLIHVNLAADAIDASYDADVAIRDDVTTATRTIRDRLHQQDERSATWAGDRIGAAVRSEFRTHLREEGLLANTSPARTPAVLHAIRDAVPRKGIVTTDVDGFRLWAKQVFETYAPESYVTAGSWAGMGVGLPAAIGAKVANPDRPVVALTGDGGLMMCLQELHTAVTEEIDVVGIVFNNADYGIISKSPAIERCTDGHQFGWSSPDFGAIAEGFGCRATRVQSPDEVRDAVTAALERDDGPELIDVAIQTDEQSLVEAKAYESTIDLADGESN